MKVLDFVNVFEEITGCEIENKVSQNGKLEFEAVNFGSLEYKISILSLNETIESNLENLSISDCIFKIEDYSETVTIRKPVNMSQVFSEIA